MTRFRITFLFLSFALSVHADFPAPPNNQEITDVPLTPPEKTVEMMRLPPGFKATVFAHEPDVQNPIAMCWDERGRLWIAENYTYSDGKERFDMKLKDRILIFEDSDNDGHFDKRTVFYDDLQMLTSIERGFGGVYALCPPHLLWIPTKDEKPSGPPQILLDGFSTTASSRHTFANGLKWGPDGWLYGRIGISSTSWIDVPGTPQEKRLPTAGGLWRYHPTRKIYEPYCHGTTNPWGMDWDEHGELFFINTVIGHLWHGIHGAHFKRMHGEDPYPHTYGLIDQHADHYHWDTGKKWTETRDASGLTGELGGGHVHIGMMIYQGINWPKEYRGKVFTCNQHGRRINCDRLEREGSGYVGKHEGDFMRSDDPWFRAVEIQYGPDGGVYVLDWADIGECHEADGVHRTSGRIYKITYGDPVKPKDADVRKLSDEELVKLQLNDNEWLVRMARWELRERAAGGKDLGQLVSSSITPLLSKEKRVPKKLNLFWMRLAAIPKNIAVTNDFTHNDFLKSAVLTAVGNEFFLGKQADNRPMPLQTVDRLLVPLASDPSTSPAIRMKLASVAGSMLPADLPKLFSPLLSHAEDATDHNLPLMYWFGIRDLPPAELVKLFKDCQIPLIRQFIARRVTEDIDKDPAPINELLTSGAGILPATRGAGILPGPSGKKPGAQDDRQNAYAADILTGMTAALKGWRKANKPEAWEKFAANVARHSDVGTSAPGAPTSESQATMLRDLNVLFGSGRALDEVRAIALDDKAGVEARRAALKTLIEAKSPGIRTICEKLLTERGLGLTAAQGLAAFDDPSIAETIIRRWRNFYPNEHDAVITALVSRPSFAKVLLKHLGGGVISRNDITPMQARQITSFNDATLTRQLSESWGEVRESSEDKKKLMAALKAKLTPEFIAKGDASQGRMLYAGICGACHKLYGEGNSIGPDLTGSGRHEVNYLIENMVDPSSVVAADFNMAVVTLKDGRVLNGIISAKTERTLTVKMVGMETTVDRDDIARQEQLPVSMMPEGQLTSLNDEQLRNLICYLMSNGQVPLPKTAEK